jgi:muramoyltetrapeptide carboxypeptidase
LRKPPSLCTGDKVGIAAPASNIQRDALDQGCDKIRDLGFEPVYDESIFERDLFFAGTVERRVHELERLFARDDVKAIVCARGGYGTNYLLSRIDVNVVKANPKIFIGYSDVTTLLTHFLDRAQVVNFHGPMVTKDIANEGGMDLSSWRAALYGEQSWTIRSDQASGFFGIRDGKCRGVLYGGCLSMLVASLGTAYEFQATNAVLFLEDVAAKPFQIDRMLMQLKLANKLVNVKGIVFGEMLDCVQSQHQDYTLQNVVLRVLEDLNVPIAFGLRSGHVTRENITLPFGVESELTVQGTAAELAILEPSVS